MGERWDAYLSNEEKMLEEITKERISKQPYLTGSEEDKIQEDVKREFFLNTGRMPKKLFEK